MQRHQHTCRHVRTCGKPCRAVPQHGSDYCFFHDPRKAAQRTAARRTGGQRGHAAVLPADTPECMVKTAVDVIALLGLTINQVRTGRLDPRVGNCIGYLAGVVLKATEQGKMEERLAALESIVTSQRRPPRAFDINPDELVVEGEDGEPAAPPRAIA